MTSPITPRPLPRIRREAEAPKHPTSPAGDQRERAAQCSSCSTSTWNVCGLCNIHCTHNRAWRHQS